MLVIVTSSRLNIIPNYMSTRPVPNKQLEQQKKKKRRMEVLYTNFQLPNRKWTVDASPHRDPAVDVYLPHRNLAVTWVPGRGKPWQYVDRKWIFQ